MGGILKIFKPSPDFHTAFGTTATCLWIKKKTKKLITYFYRLFCFHFNISIIFICSCLLTYNLLYRTYELPFPHLHTCRHTHTHAHLSMHTHTCTHIWSLQTHTHQLTPTLSFSVSLFMSSLEACYKSPQNTTYVPDFFNPDSMFSTAGEPHVVAGCKSQSVSKQNQGRGPLTPTQRTSKQKTRAQ